MFLGCNRYAKDRMDDEAGRLPKSRVPPKSKFNDEEATAVLRLIVEQEKILNDAAASPVLNITADKLKKLPPLGKSFNRESFDEDYELEMSKKSRNHVNHQDNSAPDALLCKPTLIRTKEQKEIAADDSAMTLGKATVPHIYSTPRIARRRGKERPRESYGRTSCHAKPPPARQDSLDALNTHVIGRPANPGGFHMEGDMTSRAPDSPERSDVLQLSDELLDRPICPLPPRTTTPRPSIN